jgi:hypothetical protein
MSNPFDVDGIRGELDSQSSDQQECVSWCLEGLGAFVAAAKQIPTPIQQLDLGSLAALAAGIAKAPWPTTNIDGATVAQYYAILREPRVEVGAAQDGFGLSVGIDGQFFLSSDHATVEQAADFLAEAASYDVENAKSILTNALKGQPSFI